MKPTLFLDDGGVINDNALRPEQWQRHVGAFFAPRLGGEPQAWAKANRLVVAALWSGGYVERRFGRADVAFADFERAYAERWLAGMCEQVGIEAPPEDSFVSLLQEASIAITPQVRAAYPGAVSTIQRLYGDGYTLSTASSGASCEIHGTLLGMGVRECFTHIYGGDLVNALKTSPAFYTRIFKNSHVQPETAVVLDGKVEALVWAKAAGAKVVLVGAATQGHIGTVIGELAELPTLLKRGV